MAQPSPASPPIRRRIPPLSWRRPALLWVPTALALALGWPLLTFGLDSPLTFVMLIAAAVAVALALASLGAAWALQRPPRTRRNVLEHFLVTGALVALATPFLTAALLDAAAGAEQHLTGLRTSLPYALAPMALMLGLPVAFYLGVCFGFVALVPPQPHAPQPQRRTRDTRSADERRHEVQPFV